MTDANVQEQAAHWFAALRRGPMSLEERAQFDAWRADPAHQRALDAMHELWGELSAIKAFGVSPVGRKRYRFAYVAAAAAAIVLSVGGLALMLGEAPEAQAHIQTRIGEQQTRTLPDGSVVAVNVVTTLDYESRAKIRAVKLKTGEATFFVKKSTERPFIVQVGAYQVRAAGTTFDVRFRDGLVDVAVAQGVVEISAAEGVPLVRLAAGQRAHLSGPAWPAAGPDLVKVAIKPVEPQSFAEWRLRTVNYEDVPVSTVVEDLNRFYEKPIDVRDPALARRRITIRLQVDEREDTLRTLAELLSVNVLAGERADVLAPTASASSGGS